MVTLILRVGYGLLFGGAMLSGSLLVVPHTPLLFAHHGDTSVAPENTIAAIAAATSWADGVELDVQLAPDGTWYLSHDEPTNWDLPTLEQGVTAAGDLLLDLDLKTPTLAAHVALAHWIVEHGIGARTSVNVKSIEGARAILAIVSVTIEAQPEWVPTAAMAPEVDLVTVWGNGWQAILDDRPPAEVGLFVNSIHEVGSRWDEAVAAGLARYYADGRP